MSNILKSLIVIAAVMSTSGCLSTTSYVYQRTNYKSISQSRVVCVQTSVLSTARWDDVKDELQPTFQNTESNALASAISESLSEEKLILNAIKAKLKIALTQTDTNSTDVDDSSIFDNVNMDYSAGDSINTNTKLKYSAATALYQEIALLNNYIKHYSKKKEFEPYLVRMQVTLTPFKHRENYDAYTTISFFPNRFIGLECDSLGNGNYAEGNSITPFVVPLLVSEDIESQSYNRSNDDYLQFGLGLMAAMGTIGVGGEVGSIARDFMKTTGNEYNSLMNVGRLTDNSILVRFGAMQTASEDGDKMEYIMVPRSYNVTLLLLVPKGLDADLLAVSRTKLVDIDSGKELLWTQTSTIVNEAALLLKKYLIPLPETKSEHIQKVINEYIQLSIDVQANRLDCFAGHFCKFCEAIKDTHEDEEVKNEIMDRCYETLHIREQLWTELADLWIGGQFSYTSFQVPKRVDPVYPESGLTFYGVDDGKNVNITIVGGSKLSKDNFSPILEVKYTDDNSIKLPPLALSFSDDGSTVALKYHTLETSAESDKANAETNKKEDKPTVKATYVVYTNKKKEELNYPVMLTEKTTPDTPTNEVKFEANSGMKHVLIENGSGTLQLTFSKVGSGGSTNLMKISNCSMDTDYLNKLGFNDFADKPGWMKIPKDCTIDLRISNVMPGNPVVLSTVSIVSKKEINPKELPFTPLQQTSTSSTKQQTPASSTNEQDSASTTN